MKSYKFLENWLKDRDVSVWVTNVKCILSFNFVIITFEFNSSKNILQQYVVPVLATNQMLSDFTAKLYSPTISSSMNMLLEVIELCL